MTRGVGLTGSARSRTTATADGGAGRRHRAAIVPVPRRGSAATRTSFAMLVTAVVVGLALFLIAWLAPVLAPLGLGLFLAALAAPLFSWLERARPVRGPRARADDRRPRSSIGGALVLLVLTAAQRADRRHRWTLLDDLQARYPTPRPSLATGGLMAALREVLPPDVLVGVLRTVAGILVEVGQTLVFAVVVAALLLLDGPRLARLAAGGLGSENPVFRETPGLARAAVTYFVVRIRVNARHGPRRSSS